MLAHHWLSDGWQDVVNVTSSMATVLATILAVVALLLSSRATRDAQRALARERRLDFEIDALAELVDQIELTTNRGDRSQIMRTRLRLLPPGELPATRARVREDGQYFRDERGEPDNLEPPLRTALDDWAWGGVSVRDLMRAEVDDAIKKRLLERG
ncbi:MAG: hypothetical protein ACTHQ3_08545 [Motilibacteraceae bacterium]